MLEGKLSERRGSQARGAGGNFRVRTGVRVVGSSGSGQGDISRGSALGVGAPHSRISLPLPRRRLPVAHAGSRCSMSSLGALGGARAGLGLLLGTAAGLGFLCALYSRRWKWNQRHGQTQTQSLPNSLDYTPTSEPGRQGRSPAAAVTADGWAWGPGCLWQNLWDRTTEGGGA